MYQYKLHQQINQALLDNGIRIAEEDNLFYTRFVANATAIRTLFSDIYGFGDGSETAFGALLQRLIDGYCRRPQWLRQIDDEKLQLGHWFLSNQLAGMSLYVDRFAGNLQAMAGKLEYLQDLGINLLHLMPLFESPPQESDGGYAVSDFRTVDPRYGNLEDLKTLRSEMHQRGMHLMLDIVLNHTSHRHAWAEAAKHGDPKYLKYYYFFDDRGVPDQYEQTMPEIFPESAPGNFTYCVENQKWVMSVFHQYQWDLNYRNPEVLLEMLDIIFFYANLGVDILRIDAPAFIWKQLGTTCQNLSQAHTLLRLIKLCVQVSAPGMALLGEAIVAPSAIMAYFGTGAYTSRECDFAYNATQMALQWDALATADTKVMLAAQHEILQKPYGCSWITYTRCHDDIGLGYEDYMIEQAGYNPFAHRHFLKDYYSGSWPGSVASGALFSVNPKTQDARISGSLASLCGLEKALAEVHPEKTEAAVRRICLMQAMSFFVGGVPMLFYGDEVGYTNDYSYLQDPTKSYDNRWMHRPWIDWEKNRKAGEAGTLENRIYASTRKLLSIRRRLSVLADHKNLTWISSHNPHVAGFLRSETDLRCFCLFNFSNERSALSWQVLKEYGKMPTRIFDHWKEQVYTVGKEEESLWMEPYEFLIGEAIDD